MIRPFALSAILLPAVLGGLAAQTPNHLVGITRLAPSLNHIDHANCQGLFRCFPAGFPNAAALPPYAGGTAWDPTTRGAWITNGNVLAKVDDNCTYQCPPMPIPFVGANAFATGLEVVESMNSLMLIDSAGFLHQYSLTCPPQQISMCQTGLVLQAPMQATTGLAVDEGLRLLFISYPDFATNTNWIVVSALNAPCQMFQRLQLQVCPGLVFNAITGLGVDWGRRILYATDGMTTVALRYMPVAGGIAITGQNCCMIPTPVADPMIGLAVRPGRETSLGGPCANGGCLPCPMVHSLVNDSNLGNAQFRLDLQGAPSGTMAFDILGAGPCSPPGVLVPPLCGPIFLPIVLGSLGPMPTGGTGGCTGAAVFPLPLPVVPVLIGAIISSQCLVLCPSPAGPIGTSLSNCISFELQGN